MILMAFDDDQEEVIEFVDTAFFYFFSFIIFYLCFKHLIHYFAFLEASKTETRSVKFIANQFFADFLVLDRIGTCSSSNESREGS